MRTVSLRMFSVYGPGQDLTELKQGMVSIYLAYILKGRPVEVKGSLDRSAISSTSRTSSTLGKRLCTCRLGAR